MPDPKPDQTLMALLASEADDSSAEAGGGPTFEQRIDMYLRAVYGPDAAVTADMRAAAREHLLGAMAAGLADEATIPASQPRRPSVPTIRSVAAENVRPTSDAVSRASASFTDAWQRLASIVAEAFSMRALRMAAVPLLALIVVGSVFTGDWLSNHHGGSTTDLPANEDASGQDSRTRSLTPPGQVGQTAQTASEQKLERIIADEEAALGPNDPEVANRLLELAILYHADGRYGDAEALCKRALVIQQHALGPKDPAIARTMKELASIYRAQGRNTEADEMQTKAEQP